MANANEIANVLATLVAGGMQQQDTLAEFTEKVNKEDLVKQNKTSTNVKWMAWDIVTSVGGMVINQYRQKQFEHLQEKAEKEADAQLAEREQKLNTLKENLGISAIEEHIQKQDAALENITKMLAHLNKVAANTEKEKREEKFKKEISDKAKKYLVKSSSAEKKGKEEEEDDKWC